MVSPALWGHAIVDHLNPVYVNEHHYRRKVPIQQALQHLSADVRVGQASRSVLLCLPLQDLLRLLALGDVQDGVKKPSGFPLLRSSQGSRY